MGSVYRGRHIRVGRTVAIKVLHDHLVREPGTTPTGQKAMVLEYAPGRPMAEIVTSASPPERVIALTKQLLAGLDYAHARGLVHRDLKPENILVEQTHDGAETARIVDF